jgi:hypothetical protein
MGFKAFMMGVGIYGGIVAAMFALWGTATAVIIGVTAVFLGAERRSKNSTSRVGEH